MRGSKACTTLACVDERLIEREEVIALLFNVSDIVDVLNRIENLLEEDDGEAEETDGS